MKTWHWMTTASLGFLLVAMAAFCQSARPPAMHHFESAGISFEYSYPLRLCAGGAQSCEGCVSPSLTGAKSRMITCVGYNKKVYSAYNLGQAPTLSIAVLSDIHDEAKCLAFPENGITSKPKDEQFNGVTLRTAVQTEGALAHVYRTYGYRAFHGGRCYSLELLIVILSIGAFDPAVPLKEFTAADERKVLGNFKRMFKTLHL